MVPLIPVAAIRRSWRRVGAVAALGTPAPPLRQPHASSGHFHHPAPARRRPGSRALSPPATRPVPAGPLPRSTPPAAPRQSRPPIPLASRSRWRRKRSSSLKGTANWDTAFDTLIDSFKTLTAELEKQGIKAAGNPMIVYTSTDDTGFTYLAEIPVEQEPKNLAQD